MDLLFDDFQTRKKKNVKLDDEIQPLDCTWPLKNVCKKVGWLKIQMMIQKCSWMWVLIDSNLDEVRCMNLVSWKEYFERRLDSSGIRLMEVSSEEEYDVSKHAGECED